MGDLIAIGHETNEVLDQLLKRQDISYVQGNHDEAILTIRLGKEARSQGEERLHHEWIAKNLEDKYIPFLNRMPKKIYTTIEGMTFLFVHYHLNDADELLPIDGSPSANKLDQIYEGEDVDVVCFGHHHILHHFKSNERLYVNPGALGCNIKASAPYAIIQIEKEGRIHCQFKEVSYHNETFLSDYENKNVPAKETLLRIFHGNQHMK